MAQYQVDSEQIQSSSAAVRSSIEQIRQAVQGMYANLEGLNSVWSGSASAQFAGVIRQWRAAQQQMDASLEAIGMSLTQASNVYADAEAQAAPTKQQVEDIAIVLVALKVIGLEGVAQSLAARLSTLREHLPRE